MYFDGRTSARRQHSANARSPQSISVMRAHCTTIEPHVRLLRQLFALEFLRFVIREHSTNAISIQFIALRADVVSTIVVNIQENQSSRTCIIVCQSDHTTNSLTQLSLFFGGEKQELRFVLCCVFFSYLGQVVENPGFYIIRASFHHHAHRRRFIDSFWRLQVSHSRGAPWKARCLRIGDNA